ncbi:MAG TPA: glycosyltransferase family 2 protein [Streptosporangiaceae bacterium]|nr:glycosyltransferase family 2 protein [Streptosporangiaceae bacterium]
MNERSPLVTVIVPNYNGAQPLPLCLEAVREQTYSPLEIVVADDCSTDDSVRIAQSAGVTVVRTRVNSGAAVARNTGASVAKGEVFFFVDADTALAPDAVANAVAALEQDPRIGAVCGIDEPEPLTRDSRVKEYRALQHHYWTIDSEGPISFLWSAMCAIRADVFAEIGPFNPQLRYTEEVDYGYRLNQRYTLLSTSSIHGRLDHDRELRPLLRKLFHRGRLRVPLYARKRRFASGYETSTRAWGSLAALFAVAALPLPIVLGPGWAAAPLLLVAASLACDAGMYRFVFATRRPAFAAFFVGVHFLVNLVIASSVLIGAAQWLVSGRFRRLYDTTLAAAPEATG